MTTSPAITMGPDQHNEIRDQVRRLLDRSESFTSLEPEQRRKLAHDLVEVVSFLADPAAGVGRAPSSSPLAVIQASDEKKGQGTGADFTGGAAREGGAVMAQLVDDVDFPEFVSSLIEGVFQSIVDASIRQMEAYSTLLEAVVSSVKDFADENVSPDAARDYVVNKYPSAFRRKGDGPESPLEMNPEADEDQLPDMKAEFGEGVTTDIDDAEMEAKLVESARLKMARMRQQQLATMVLMGINRIIVTDGKINAKVMFQVSATDTARARDERSYQRQYEQASEHKRSYSSIWSATKTSSKVNTKVSSAYSSKSERESESKLEMKAKLTGEVTVNFKSETFPLERLDPAQLGMVQAKA